MSGLEFRIRDIEEDGATLVTSMMLTVYVDDFAVWPVHGDDDAALDIQIDDLLSHLTEFWKPLLLRQTYPLGLNPARPSELTYQARRRWAEKPEEQAAAEDEILERFAECHDLSRCFAGYFDLPSLWLIRRGEQFIVEGPGGASTIPFAAACEGLSCIGDTIAKRLEGAAERWSDLVTAWREREAGESLNLLRWSTSLDLDVAASLAKEGLLRPPETLAEAANDNDELRLAARMASALPLDQIRNVLELVRAFPSVDAPALTELAKVTRAYFDADLSDLRPFEQGEGLAQFVRERLGIGRSQRVDIFALLERLGIVLRVQSVEPRDLDALAVSGPSHGPAILLNSAAVQLKPNEALQMNGRARVTMAHEFCHFLVDAHHALSAVDVLGGLMPLIVEQRARAFGAAFLLPSQAAADVWQELGALRSRQGLQRTLDALCERFDVAYSVAAWKLEHGARITGADLEAMLWSLVPNR